MLPVQEIEDSPGTDTGTLALAITPLYLAPMEEAIQETERKINIIQKMADNCQEGQQKAFYQRCLQNAKQVLANLREMDRIVNGGA
jgi:hypothetical protein